jgi:hypothetical protein
MIFDLNCKPFSPADTGRKTVANAFPATRVSSPFRKIYCYNLVQPNPAKTLLNHAQTTTKKH